MLEGSPIIRIVLSLLGLDSIQIVLFLVDLDSIGIVLSLLGLDSMLADGSVACTVWLSESATAVSDFGSLAVGDKLVLAFRSVMRQSSNFQFVCIATFSQVHSSFCSRSSSQCRTNHHRQRLLDSSFVFLRTFRSISLRR